MKKTVSDWDKEISVARGIDQRGSLESDVEEYNRKRKRESAFMRARRELDNVLADKRDRDALREVWE